MANEDLERWLVYVQLDPYGRMISPRTSLQDAMATARHHVINKHTIWVAVVYEASRRWSGELVERKILFAWPDTEGVEVEMTKLVLQD